MAKDIYELKVTTYVFIFEQIAKAKRMLERALTCWEKYVVPRVLYISSVPVA